MPPAVAAGIADAMRVFAWSLIVAACALGQERPKEEFAASEDRPPTRRDVGGPGGFGGFGNGGGPGYSLAWYPDADFGMVRQSLNGGYPVWKEEGRTLIASVGVRHLAFDTDLILPDSGRPFPSDLWDVTAGVTYLHKFDDGWSGAVFARVGSASDRPFHSLRELYGSLGAFLTVPAENERDNWLFGLFYSAAGSLNFPVPGLAYVWNPSEEWRITAGIPFAVQWKPTDDWTFNLSYLPVTNITARGTFRATDAVSVYAGYEYLSDAYFLADRAEKRDRFFVLEQRVFAGASWQLAKRWSVDGQLGYAFGRDFGEGDGQRDLERDRVSAGSGAYMSASLRFGF